MSCKIKMLLICVVSLGVGTIIYIFSRPDVYISRIILNIFNIKETCKIIPSVISFFVPDFLWALGLCSGLFAVCSIKNGWIWGAVTVFYGTAWELLQYFSVVPGTADIIDVILYLTAAVLAVVINNYLKKREKQ